VRELSHVSQSVKTRCIAPSGAVLAKKFWWGALPRLPLHHQVHFLRSRKPKKNELHIGLHLKSIMVANPVVGWTLRPIDTRSGGPRAGVGFLAGGSEPPPRQRGSWEHCKLPQRGLGQSPAKFGFWSIFGLQKSRPNGQLAFESGEGGGGKCSPAPT